MPCDPRFLAESGREVFTGNELLIKGALETKGGVHLLTGYPGSPVAGFFDTLGDVKDLLNEHGVRAFQANNEALGVAAVNGSQMAPCRAIATMKSVGVHVASDALAIGNLALLKHPDAHVLGTAYRLFDVGGVIGTIGMGAMLLVAVTRHTYTLYQAERLN